MSTVITVFLLYVHILQKGVAPNSLLPASKSQQHGKQWFCHTSDCMFKMLMAMHCRLARWYNITCT
jgi:hypothetical protein